jgi:hypothetical protein
MFVTLQPKFYNNLRKDKLLFIYHRINWSWKNIANSHTKYISYEFLLSNGTKQKK